MYDKIDTLADEVADRVAEINAHEVWHQPEVDLESIILLALAMMEVKSEKRSSKQTGKSQKTRDSGSESDGRSSNNGKHASRRINWRDTEQCYRCHKTGHIVRDCPSTAPVESAALTETAAAMMTSIEQYWMTVTGRCAEGEGWYIDCATTSHICGDQQKFELYIEYIRRKECGIHDFAGRVTGKPIGYGDVRWRLRLPGYRRNTKVVVRNILHIEGAHNMLSQLQLIDWGFGIVPVDGYGIKILDKAPAASTGRGQGSLSGVVCHNGGIFRLDVQVAGKRYRRRE
jgi:hypothetical protein